MIVYNPTDGEVFTTAIKGRPKHCFLMTRLGDPVPKMVQEISDEVKTICDKIGYKVIDASTQIRGGDFLIKIWKLLASVPFAIGVVHEDIPAETQANIFYELGIAQALGKETIIVKSPKAKIPSDLIRSEYIVFNDKFTDTFPRFMKSLKDLAEHYELVADQLDRNPILVMDYLKRAYLITGEAHLKDKVRAVFKDASLQGRAKNSVESLYSTF